MLVLSDIHRLTDHGTVPGPNLARQRPTWRQRPVWRRVAANTGNVSGHMAGHKNNMASFDRPRERQCNWLNPPQGMPLTDSLAVSQRVLWYLCFHPIVGPPDRYGDPSRFEIMSVLEKDVAVLFEKLVQDNSGMRVAGRCPMRRPAWSGPAPESSRRRQTGHQQFHSRTMAVR
jgi:hypothetical protein